MRKPLTKTLLMSGLQCPKRLYLEIHRPDLVEGNHANDLRLNHGRQVGNIARALRPNGILIDFPGNTQKALKETRERLSNVNQPLFEAAFTYKDILVRTDVFLKFRGNHMTEVKSSTSVKDHYLMDCAIQAWVLEKSGVDLKSIRLAYINKKFTYKGDDDFSEVFLEENITKEVRIIQKTLTRKISVLQSMLNGELPGEEMGDHCNRPYPCPFIDFCSPEATEYPVTLLPYGKKIADALMEQGIEDITDIPEGRLEKPSWERIRRVTCSGQYELDAELVTFMQEQGWPRYFLDFETIQFAVPIWKDTRPYQQLPFQWSCHIEQKTGNVTHKEYLHTGGEPPMREFAQSLIKTLRKCGPIFVYSSFEKSRLSELAVRFPDLSDELNAIIARLVDLLPYTRKHYYHPEMRGSYSLKAVLPTVAPDLNYQSLDQVHDGTEAQAGYLEMNELTTDAKRRKQLKEALLEYCKLDTLALVRLARFFEGD